MAVVGDLEDRQRMPRIGNDQGVGPPESAQQRDHQSHDHGFATYHREAQRERAFGNAGDGQKEHLRNRRIGGQRIVGTVDVRIDCITQRRKCRVGRHMGIRIDPGGLHAAVPDVAIEIGRE